MGNRSDQKLLASGITPTTHQIENSESLIEFITRLIFGDDSKNLAYENLWVVLCVAFLFIFNILSYQGDFFVFTGTKIDQQRGVLQGSRLLSKVLSEDESSKVDVARNEVILFGKSEDSYKAYIYTRKGDRMLQAIDFSLESFEEEPMLYLLKDDNDCPNLLFSQKKDNGFSVSVFEKKGDQYVLSMQDFLPFEGSILQIVSSEKKILFIEKKDTALHFTSFSLANHQIRKEDVPIKDSLFSDLSSNFLLLSLGEEDYVVAFSTHEMTTSFQVFRMINGKMQFLSESIFEDLNIGKDVSLHTLSDAIFLCPKKPKGTLICHMFQYQENVIKDVILDVRISEEAKSLEDLIDINDDGKLEVIFSSKKKGRASFEIFAIGSDKRARKLPISYDTRDILDGVFLH